MFCQFVFILEPSRESVFVVESGGILESGVILESFWNLASFRNMTKNTTITLNLQAPMPREYTPQRQEHDTNMTRNCCPA